MLSGQEPAPAATPWERTEAGHWLRVAAVPACAAEAVAVLWPHPHQASADDQRALAVAVAVHRAAAADKVLPAGAATTFEVGDAHTAFTVVLPKGTRGGAAAWLQALATASTADADAAARSLARAALAADDAQWLHPGEILLGRSRRVLAAGTRGGSSAGGSPAFLQALSVAAFGEVLALPLPEPLRAAVVGAGAGADALRGVLDHVAVRLQARAAAAATAPEAAALNEACTPHQRIDAPYIGAAVRAPLPSPATLTFALAIEVLRARADARFRSYRGGEPIARAPFVGYQFLLGDSVVLFCRRGPLEVDAAVPRGELQALLAAARQEPPTRSEIASAAGLLLAEWAVPPWTPAREAILRQMPQGLGPRARTLCLLGHWGIDDAMVLSLPAASAEAVAACLADALRPGSLWWGGLVPTTAPLLAR